MYYEIKCIMKLDHFQHFDGDHEKISVKALMLEDIRQRIQRRKKFGKNKV